MTKLEQVYGPQGDWAKHFARSPGYLGTELLRWRVGGLSYLTIDRWKSVRAYEEFRIQHEEAHRALDEDCKDLTLLERSLGALHPRGGLSEHLAHKRRKSKGHGDKMREGEFAGRDGW
jgi:hypothetical protein